MPHKLYNYFGISAGSSITKTENVTLDSSKSTDPNTPGNIEGDGSLFNYFGCVKIIVRSYEILS